MQGAQKIREALIHGCNSYDDLITVYKHIYNKYLLVAKNKGLKHDGVISLIRSTYPTLRDHKHLHVALPEADEHDIVFVLEIVDVHEECEVCESLVLHENTNNTLIPMLHAGVKFDANAIETFFNYGECKIHPELIALGVIDITEDIFYNLMLHIMTECEDDTLVERFLKDPKQLMSKTADEDHSTTYYYKLLRTLCAAISPADLKSYVAFSCGRLES
jgi:hypothetical protein